MEDIDSTVALREKLLAAGIDEILAHGVSGFSLRRVAAACGASCAAPYKHFKNKDEFIKEIIAYVEEKWELLAKQITCSFEDPKERIAQLCVANVRFRIANPLYGTGNSSFKDNISEDILNICKTKGYTNSDERIFILLALSSGVASLIDQGHIDNSQRAYDILYKKVIKEL